MKHVRRRLLAIALAAATILWTAPAGGAARAADEERKVPAPVAAAVQAYLRAPPEKERGALDKACGLLKDDVALAAAAVRAAPPLTSAKPGTAHGVRFASGGRDWEFSIHLPKGYDGRRRFPVLVLPDHGSVSAEDGIAFWRDKPGAEDLILFRPVVVRYQEDRERFPDQQFFARDAAVAAVYRDALTHLRLHYAVDDDRLCVTGLSQAGFYTWYLGVSFPDDFAGIVPESSGGTAVRAAVRPLAANVAGLAVRILHAEGDQICPYEDATAMRDAIEAAGGHPELITYADADYGAQPFPKRHPGPHALRLRNVLDWIAKVVRTPAAATTRVLRHPQQGREGRWVLTPPVDATKPLTVVLSDEDGVLSAEGPDRATYLASPEDVAAGREFTVAGKKVRAKPDVRLLLQDFKRLGDRGRVGGGAIEVR